MTEEERQEYIEKLKWFLDGIPSKYKENLRYHLDKGTEILIGESTPYYFVQGGKACLSYLAVRKEVQKEDLPAFISRLQKDQKDIFEAFETITDDQRKREGHKKHAWTHFNRILQKVDQETVREALRQALEPKEIEEQEK